MYCDYYGFKAKPFNLTPDPGFIFLSDYHNEAFAHLLYGIDHHVGFIALTGEIGAGKTTVIRTLLGQLSPDRYRTALIFNPCLSSLGLMQFINREYGLNSSHTDTSDLLNDLYNFLLRENAANRTVVLVVDEAQNLGSSVLEQIRLISNLESEQDKLIQIVLVGQPELRGLLSRPELRQLGQRVGVNYHLRPMTLTDTRAYIVHRLQLVSESDLSLFTDRALKRIYRYSGGLPRLINLACDRALLLGYTRDKIPITALMAETAIADIRLTAEKPFRLRPVGLALLLGVCLTAAGFYYLARKQTIIMPTSPPHHVPAVPQPPSFPVETAMRDLASLPEIENTLATFTVISGLWHATPVDAGSARPVTPETLARLSGLSTLRFTGNLGALLRLDYPALLELVPAGMSGKRYIAVTGYENSRYSITPSIAGRTSLSASELDSIWSGRGYIIWKNHLNMNTGLKSGSIGPDVTQLQNLLHQIGYNQSFQAGLFDQLTAGTIKSFQISHGLKPDGNVGTQTLMLLYRAVKTFPSPSLSHPVKGHL